MLWKRTARVQAIAPDTATSHVTGALTCIPRIAVSFQQQQVARGCLVHSAATPRAKAAGVAAYEALQLPPVCIPIVQELRAPAAVRDQAAHLRHAAPWEHS